MSDLIGGLYPKAKNANAPEYVIGKLSINVSQFREWMRAHLLANPNVEWINVDMKVSKEGKGYAVVDTWKPGDKPAAAKQPEPASDFADQDIHF